MKKRIREIARTGTFTSGDKSVTVTRKILSEIAKTFEGANPAPVVLGHEIKATSPRLGNVKSLRLADDGNSLIAEIEENDALYDAVNKKYFPDCSIGAKRQSDGRYYLHHLAYLGEEPPAIKNLKNEIKETLVASDFDDFVILPAVNLADKLTNIEESKMDELEKLKARNAELEKQLADAQAKKPDDQASADAEALKKENEELMAKVKELTEKLEKITAEYPEIELADASGANRVLYNELRKTKRENLLKAASGKISKVGVNKLSVLANELSLSDCITLSDGKTKKSGIDLLTEIFDETPSMQFLQNEVVLADGQQSVDKAIDVNKLMSCI